MRQDLFTIDANDIVMPEVRGQSFGDDRFDLDSRNTSDRTGRHL